MNFKKTAALTFTAAATAVAAKYGPDYLNTRLLCNVKKLDDNIGLCDYRLPYDLDYFLEKGVSNTGEVLSHIAGKSLVGRALKFGKGDFACSSFDAVSEDGDHIYARNFDYKTGPCMVVWTHPENGYESIGIADSNFMLYGNNRNILKDKNRFQSVLAPYCCMDGINEKGLTIGILELKTKATKQETGKKPITTTVAIRGVLDKCATVAEAVEFFKSYDMHDALFCCYHYQIADANGDSVVIEYVNNEMRLFYPEKKSDDVFPSQYITNFFLSEDGDNFKGFGYDRYTRMQTVLGKKNGKMSEDEAMELLEKVHLHYKHDVYPWYVITLWSAVYNCNKGTLKLCAGLDYSKAYSFDIHKPAEAVSAEECEVK